MTGRRADVGDLLRRRVVGGLHLGLLKPGDRLPSVRALVAELGVHQRVVVAAYQALERDGLVVFRARSGVYVAPTAMPVGGMLPAMAERVVDFLVDALALGMSAPEMPERLRRCLETLPLRAVCVECNADQLESLCRQVQRDYGLDSTGIDLATLAAPEARVAIRHADVLITTSFHAAEVRHAAEAAGKPWIAIALRADVVAEIRRYLAEGPVYFVGTDPRFADKVRAMFGGVPGGANARPVILGHDDAGQIPDNAPAYVMHSAAAQLGGTPLSARVPALERTFSPESAREILAFVVRANMAAVAAQMAAAPAAAPAANGPGEPLHGREDTHDTTHQEENA